MLAFGPAPLPGGVAVNVNDCACASPPASVAVTDTVTVPPSGKLAAATSRNVPLTTSKRGSSTVKVCESPTSGSDDSKRADRRAEGIRIERRLRKRDRRGRFVAIVDDDGDG